MKPTIRKIEARDLSSVIALLRDFAEYEKLSEYCTATEEKFYAAMFGDNAVAQGLIALNGETPIGYAIFYPNFSTFRGQPGLYLEDIYIKSEYRGGGLGETLLKQIASIAHRGGFERIDFMVLDWNMPAINFYKKLGAKSNEDETHFKFTDEAFTKLAS
jgi:ribosomal protein S18 acetylase RimI-like enzyme